MTIDLTGRRAFVAASSRGIGLGVARSLLHAGASVAISGRDEARLYAAAAELDSERVVVARGDLADRAQVNDLVATARAGLGGPIDILVCNCGGPPTGSALELGEEEWAQAIEGILLSTVRLCRLVVPDMQARGFGRVIVLASTTAKEPESGMALSSSTRAAVVAFAKTLAREAGPDGVTVNTILTGGVLTDRMRQLLEEEAHEKGESYEEVLHRAYGLFPAGFIPTPDDFAGPIVYLASEEAAFVNGVALELDGGLTRSLF